MNNRTIAAIYLIIAILIFPVPLLAATATGSTYDVELVVFQNLMPELEGKEIWSPERVDLKLADIDKAAKAADSQDEKTDLGKAIVAMNESKRYRVLAHKRWTQTAEAKSTSPVMRIRTDDGELDGTFVFYLSRFLHIDAQMLLRDESASPINVTVPGNSSQTGHPGTSTEKSTDLQLTYRIDESRRIRSNEINYLDHPKFGVLVQVTPKE